MASSLLPALANMLTALGVESLVAARNSKVAKKMSAPVASCLELRAFIACATLFKIPATLRFQNELREFHNNPFAAFSLGYKIGARLHCRVAICDRYLKSYVLSGIKLKVGEIVPDCAQIVLAKTRLEQLVECLALTFGALFYVFDTQFSRTPGNGRRRATADDGYFDLMVLQ